MRAQPFLEIFSREQYRMYVRVELKLAASQGNAMVQAPRCARNHVLLRVRHPPRRDAWQICKAVPARLSLTLTPVVKFTVDTSLDPAVDRIKGGAPEF